MNWQTNKILKIAIPVIFGFALLGVSGYYFSSLTATHITGMTSLAGSSFTHHGMVCQSPVCDYGIGTAAQANCLTQVANCTDNTYTNMGKNATRDYLFKNISGPSGAPGGFNAFNVISIGMINNSQIATDRCLANQTGAGAGCDDFTGNGLSPATGTVAEVRGSGSIDFGNVSITNTFTCTLCSSQIINATGLYNSTTNSGSGNNTNVGALSLFAEANFTTATLQTNDQINVTWFIWTS